MADNKTIKNFTAADIEQYWNKKLSPAEMHALEKAAMDDPFLADALEGYHSSKNPGEELRILKERFHKKTGAAAAIIPVHRKRYGWLRIAAAIIVLACTGLLIQQLVFKNNNGSSPIVNVEEAKDNKINEATTSNSTGRPANETVSAEASTQSEPVKPQKESSKAITNNAVALTNDDTIKFNINKTTDDKLVKEVTELKNEEVVTKAAEKKESREEKLSEANAVTSVPGFADKENAGIKSKALKQDYYSQAGMLNNRYTYRVVDAQNNPVPFANVTNTRDKVGTYTDIKGEFNLVSSDSVLDVQIRSLGYNSENYRLIPSKQTNNLILKEDAVARNQMDLYQGRGRVSNVSRKDSAEIEEPEVGWGNYNTYVENNIKIPDNLRAKNTLNEVELSFDIDNAGHPVNIRVTKSSQCKECDDEAIRLLKEGPKWKKRGKKARTTISISVDK